MEVDLTIDDDDVAIADPDEALEDVVAFGKKSLHWKEVVLSLAVTVALCAFLYFRMDFNGFRDGLARANYAWLLPVIAVSTVGWFIRGLRWQVLLRPFSDVHYSEVFRVFMVGTSISAVIPARAGEFWRAHAMGRHSGLSRFTVFGSIVVERVIDGMSLVFMASLALLAAKPSTAIGLLVGGMAVLFTIALALLLVLARSLKAQARAIKLITTLTPGKLKLVAHEKTEMFMHGLGSLRSGQVFLAAFGLSFGVYLLDALAYWMMGESFGLHMDAQGYLLAVVVGNLAMAMPVSIGGLGPYEFFVQQAFVLQGAHADTALALALFMHVLILGIALLIGVIVLWRRPAATHLKPAVSTQG